MTKTTKSIITLLIITLSLVTLPATTIQSSASQDDYNPLIIYYTDKDAIPTMMMYIVQTLDANPDMQYALLSRYYDGSLSYTLFDNAGDLWHYTELMRGYETPLHIMSQRTKRLYIN